MRIPTRRFRKYDRLGVVQSCSLAARQILCFTLGCTRKFLQ